MSKTKAAPNKKKKEGLSHNQIIGLLSAVFFLFLAFMFFTPPKITQETPTRVKNPSTQQTTQGEFSQQIINPQFTEAMQMASDEQTKKEGLEKIISLANQKNPDAMNYLGYLHTIGEGVEKDVKKSYQLFLEASNLGNINSLYALGIIHMNGDDEDLRDPKKAVEFWKKASDLGHGPSATFLGKCYKTGRGTEVNDEAAKEQFEKASKARDPEGMFYFSRLLMSGTTDEQERGVQLLRDSADIGHLPAMTTLGELHMRGTPFVKKDLIKARKFFESAAKKGESVSMYNLGVVYETTTKFTDKSMTEEVPVKEGEKNKFGVVPDLKKSLEFFERSSEDYSEAMYALYQIYSKGDRVEQNNKVAAEYLFNAAGEGSHAAAMTLLELNGSKQLDSLVNLSNEQFTELLSLALSSYDPEIKQRARAFYMRFKEAKEREEASEGEAEAEAEAGEGEQEDNEESQEAETN